MTGAGASLPQLGITGAHTGDTLRIVDVFRKSDDDEHGVRTSGTSFFCLSQIEQSAVIILADWRVGEVNTSRVIILKEW
jgi:hypothetical protein